MSARDDYPNVAAREALDIKQGWSLAHQYTNALDEIDFLRGFPETPIREHIDAAFDQTWRSIHGDRYEFHRDVFLDMVEQIFAISTRQVLTDLAEVVEVANALSTEIEVHFDTEHSTVADALIALHDTVHAVQERHPEIAP